MRKIFSIIAIAALFTYSSCSNEKKENTKTENSDSKGKRTIEGGSPAAYAAQWCDLNSRLHYAAEGADKEAAKAALKNFEEGLEAQFKNDDAFMKEIEKEVEKCEDASEGR